MLKSLNSFHSGGSEIFKEEFIRHQGELIKQQRNSDLDVSRLMKMLNCSVEKDNLRHRIKIEEILAHLYSFDNINDYVKVHESLYTLNGGR